MRDLCNTDKPLFAVLTKLTYSAYLNILWLVCSLPIVTIGASTTASVSYTHLTLPTTSRV